MKEKIRNILVMEGGDLAVVPLFFMCLFSVIAVVNAGFEKFKTLFIVLACLTFVGVAIVIYSLIWCLINTWKDKSISRNRKIVITILLLIFDIYYIPIYYCKYVTKKRLWYGILDCVLYAVFYLLSIGLGFSAILIGNTYDKISDYTSNDGLISASLNGNWDCLTEEIGGHALYCYNLKNDDTIGIFNYTDREVDAAAGLLDFHAKQINDTYIEESYSVIDEKKLNKRIETVLKSGEKELTTIVDAKIVDDNLITIVVYVLEDDDDFDELTTAISKK